MTRLTAARWCAAAVAMLCAGCSAPGTSLESSPEVSLHSIEVPVHDPVWSYRRQALVALTDDHRLAEMSALDQSGVRTRLSDPLDTGRNLQISQKDTGLVLVPQPHTGRVAVVDLASLRTVQDFPAGPAPSYLSENAGLRMLLVLSADGLSVTPVQQYGWKTLLAAPISGGPAHSIGGANRGRAIDFHLYGSSGIRHYTGPSWPAPERGSLTMDVTASAGDGTKATRSYVATRGQGDVLYAVDSRRGGQGMEVVGRAALPSSPIRFLGTDDTRVYAATDHDLVVLETASFTGYPGERIPIIRVTDYRSALPAGARSAPLSGMAIGPHRVYLPLAGLPFVISVAKPRL